MAAYYAIIEKEPDSLWSLWFPDLPGCVAAGETADAATDNAVAALRDWIELQPAHLAIPAASSLEELSRREDVRTPGALSLVRIPVTARSGRVVRINISLDEGVLAAIDDAATRRGMNRSAFLASAAESELRRAV